MLEWLWSSKKTKAKEPKRTIVEEKIHERLTDIITEACRYFQERAECSKDFIYMFDYSNKASQFGFCLENHLYSKIGERIRLGNTSICGGSIRTVDTSKDRLGLPRAIYKIRLPIYGQVMVEYFTKKWSSSGKGTVLRPVVRVVFSAFEKENSNKVSQLFSLTVKEDIATDMIGYASTKENTYA